jgi:hypothetical protein
MKRKVIASLFALRGQQGKIARVENGGVTV